MCNISRNVKGSPFSRASLYSFSLIAECGVLVLRLLGPFLYFGFSSVSSYA